MSSKQPPHRRVVGKLFTIVSWLVFVPLTAASLAWLFAGFAWKIDLVANLGAQCLLVTLPFAVLWAITRRWLLLGLTLLACLSHACSLGSHRATWFPQRESSWIPGDERAIAHVPGDGGVLRVVHFNASSYNSPQTMLQALKLSGADIVSWTELSWPMFAAMASTTPLSEEYPYRAMREYDENARTAAGYGFILSKLPMEPFDLDGIVNAPLQREFLACVVTLPPGMTTSANQPGKIGVIAMHPASPRTDERWRMGNIVTDAGINIVNAMRAKGLEVIVLADLNSTPGGVRSHALCAQPGGGGLSRGKPIFEFFGTYPVKWDWPRSVAIDDVFFSEGLSVQSWRRGEPLGSDHYSVLLEIAPSK